MKIHTITEHMVEAKQTNMELEKNKSEKGSDADSTCPIHAYCFL